MEWQEIIILCESELSDLLSELLVEHTGRGVVIEGADEGKEILKAYLALDSSFSEKMQALEKAVQPFTFKDKAVLSSGIIPDQDWGHKWKEFFQPQAIGKSIVIKPSWSDFQGRMEQIIIEIDPGMAFGTGTHSSTRLVIEALESALTEARHSPKVRVLDVGTGTGILAMAAAGMGASEVLAIDVDPEAVSIAAENVRLNRLDDCVSVSGVPLETISDQFAVVLANIIYSELVRICPQLYRVTEPDGTLIVSGILTEQTPQLIGIFRKYGFHNISSRFEGEWECITFRKDPR